MAPLPYYTIILQIYQSFQYDREEFIVNYFIITRNYFIS